ncbi:MAG: LysR family transcriptional regulator [Steroidobacteraceae bacterium]
MELRQLRHFIAVARLGNLHRAAEELHLSQQALSASLARLEQDLGAQLIVRGRHGATLSAFGEKLLPRALTIVGEARVARAELEGLSAATHGHLRAGVGAFFANHVFPEALLQFAVDFPRVDITVVEATSSDLYDALLRGELDFAISTPAFGVEVSAQIESEQLFETRDAIFMRFGHPLAERATVGLRDLADYPWIVSARFGDYRARLEAAFRDEGLEPPARVMRTDSVPVMGYVLQHSDAVALLGNNPFRGMPLPPLGPLRDFAIPVLEGAYRGVLAWRRSAMLPAAEALMQRLRHTIRTRLEPPID